ncbi:putative protein TPRXL isoform X2 [Gambusia affinis]|uniref:putative protein TPRXL isoform X2 n=1 Tax=Gambusia affinis TaxID=33528 RepID=UPI001CDD60B8|nr:putative protein TPRXL isoform X2 [Gambusia affinis]
MQSASQVGHRANSVSSSSIMASVVFKKDAGIVCLLLSGFLLPSVFVSGQTTDMSTTSSPAAMTTASTMNTTTSAANPSMTMSTTTSNTNQAASMTNSISTASPTQSTMSTTYGGTVMSTAIQSLTTSSDSVSQNTHSASSTSGGSSSSSTHSPSTTSEGPSSHSTHSASSTSGGSSSSSTDSNSATSEGNMTEENKNTTSNSSMEMINCPSFTCYHSGCYSKYISQNESHCSTGESCQLLKSVDMWYNVSCSASCVEDCNNPSQSNCSVNCCNSTGCIKDIFVPMMMTTTVAATTTTNAPPTTRTTSTTADKGNKCHKGSCTGENCYKNFKELETCSSTDPHCQDAPIALDMLPVLGPQTPRVTWSAALPPQPPA